MDAQQAVTLCVLFMTTYVHGHQFGGFSGMEQFQLPAIASSFGIAQPGVGLGGGSTLSNNGRISTSAVGGFVGGTGIGSATASGGNVINKAISGGKTFSNNPNLNGGFGFGVGVAADTSGSQHSIGFGGDISVLGRRITFGQGDANGRRRKRSLFNTLGNIGSTLNNFGGLLNSPFFNQQAPQFEQSPGAFGPPPPQQQPGHFPPPQQQSGHFPQPQADFPPQASHVAAAPPPPRSFGRQASIAAAPSSFRPHSDAHLMSGSNFSPVGIAQLGSALSRGPGDIVVSSSTNSDNNFRGSVQAVLRPFDSSFNSQTVQPVSQHHPVEAVPQHQPAAPTFSQQSTVPVHETVGDTFSNAADGNASIETRNVNNPSDNISNIHENSQSNSFKLWD